MARKPIFYIAFNDGKVAVQSRPYGDARIKQPFLTHDRAEADRECLALATVYPTLEPRVEQHAFYKQGIF